jgi:hypothetical protein
MAPHPKFEVLWLAVGRAPHGFELLDPVAEECDGMAEPHAEFSPPEVPHGTGTDQPESPAESGGFQPVAAAAVPHGAADGALAVALGKPSLDVLLGLEIAPH